MQAASNRLPGREVGRTASSNASPPLGLADDRALLEALPIAAGVFGLKNKKLWVHALNGRFFELAGCHADTSRFRALFEHYQGSEGGQAVRAFLKNPATANDEFDYSDGEGVRGRFLKLKLAPLAPDADGDPRCLLSVVDRTVEVQSERTLRAEMLRDSLTGLPNRVAFSEALEEAEARLTKDDDHAVLVVDMLRFSRINESMGGLAGDELLITFARRLVLALRAGDVLARTGGNEFGVLVTLRRGVEDALTAAERIQDVMSTPFKISDLEIKVDCAIGVALMHADQDPEELFRNAQFAVKQAKVAGRPQVYEPKQATEARRRFSIETELRRAIEKEQLDLYFQPLINLKSGKVSGFEALARWDHADRGAISPQEFIPVAEESGLILHLGRWAMHKALSTLAEWDREAGTALPIHVGVNMSAIQVARDNAPALVADSLKSSGIGGERLTIELTESAIVQDPGRAQRVFEALKAHRATVAMDDFGTGYSSLAYLQRLPIDVLKIDQSFVSGMMNDADSVAIVRAILSLADALGMSTTAEGIETVELATTLAALGCAAGQGYYFSRPLDSVAALEFVRSRQD